MYRASKPPCFLLVVVIATSCLTINVSSVNEPSSAPGPAPHQGFTCEDFVISNMFDCITFITAGSLTDRPKGTCCSGLKTVLDFNGACICAAIAGSSQYGVRINMTRAEQLPLMCNLKPYPLQNCGISSISGRSTSPVMSPPNPSPSPATPQSDTVPKSDSQLAPEADDGGPTTPAEAPQSLSSGSHGNTCFSLATFFMSISIVVYSYMLGKF